MMDRRVFTMTLLCTEGVWKGSRFTASLEVPDKLVNYLLPIGDASAIVQRFIERSPWTVLKDEWSEPSVEHFRAAVSVAPLRLEEATECAHCTDECANAHNYIECEVYRAIGHRTVVLACEQRKSQLA